LLLCTLNGCMTNQNAQSTANKADSIKKAEIIRRPTLFDRKDTNSTVGKCFLKINENIADFCEVEPKNSIDQWLLPFAVKNRRDISQIKVRSPFGANRTSHLRGHKHSGADIVPVNMDTGIYIYPAAKGIVCFKRIKDPFSSITIKHKLPNGSFMFTSYIHLKEIYVADGDTVDTNTKIGKLFNHKEVRRFRGPYDHLHFEVRKSFDDFGFGSSHCMNKSELDSFFYEPVNFLRDNIKNLELAHSH
jgi:murein DD-endopeptidase MepM/ murein hydrolase activator NlpD